jgi:hypothetical protein
MWSNIRLIGIATALIAAFAAGCWVNGSIWEKRLKSRLKAQQEQLITQCNEQKKITEDNNNENLKKLRVRDATIANYKRLHETPKPVSITSAASNGNGAGGGYLNGGSYAVTDFALIDYSAIAERYRVQLLGCQSFISKVWSNQ